MYEDIIRRLEPVQGRVDAVLDTDAFNEIDDQFALAYLLAYPERVNLLAVTAAPFFNERSTSPEDGMLKSYDEIIKVARLCGRNDAKELAYLGARNYLPDENTPVDSPAARRIAELALRHGADEPLYVVAIGAITNVASALLMEPAINNRIVVVWLGGHSLNTMVFLLVVAAVVLGIVVLYNLGVMSYTERYREMATLKVVGFRDAKIGLLLVGQNLWLTVIGILIGLPAGWGVLKYLLEALASEYEMKLVIGPVTYIVSILLTFGVSCLVGLMVARKNRHIDMVAALKTEE